MKNDDRERLLAKVEAFLDERLVDYAEHPPDNPVYITIKGLPAKFRRKCVTRACVVFNHEVYNSYLSVRLISGVVYIAVERSREVSNV